MSYAGYVFAAYAVFALVLGWDYLAPRLRLRRVQRGIATRVQRDAARRAAAPLPVSPSDTAPNA